MVTLANIAIQSNAQTTPESETAMNPSDKNLPASTTDGDSIDFSDLLGAGQAFPAHADASTRDALIDAHCNKIGTEACT